MGKKKQYDHLIIAVHSDQVKNVINLRNEEKKIFENIRYTNNIVYVHSDKKLMPESKKVWSSWNYIEDKENMSGVNVTYWMNKLQKLNTNLNLFVSLNHLPHLLRKKYLKYVMTTHCLILIHLKIKKNNKNTRYKKYLVLEHI